MRANSPSASSLLAGGRVGEGGAGLVCVAPVVAHGLMSSPTDLPASSPMPYSSLQPSTHSCVSSGVVILWRGVEVGRGWGKGGALGALRKEGTSYMALPIPAPLLASGE